MLFRSSEQLADAERDWQTLAAESVEAEAMVVKAVVEGEAQPSPALEIAEIVAEIAEVDLADVEQAVVEAQVQQRKEALGAFDDEVRALNEACEALDKLRADGVVELKDLEHRLAREQKEQAAAALGGNTHTRGMRIERSYRRR